MEVIVSVAELTVMLSAFVAVCAGEPESVPFTVKLLVPAVVGIPVIAPVAAFKFNPAGKAPVVIDHVTAPVPPVAPSVVLYAVPTVPFGRLVVETASAALIVIVSALVTVCAGEPESVAFTVKFAVPAAVGVPVMAPVAAFKFNPAGNAPDGMVQVTAPVPPVDPSAPV